MKHQHTRRRGLAAVIGLLGAAALVAGCGAGDGGVASSASAPGGLDQDQARPGQDSTTGDDGAAEGGDDGAAGGGEGGSTGAAPEESPQGDLAPDGTPLTEQIVRTGDISVAVDNLVSSANRITSLVQAAGGTVGSDQRYGTNSGSGNGTGSVDLVLRVPPDALDGLIDEIAGLGDEQSRTLSADDVSTVVADIDSRVQTLQTSVDRLRALAAQAISVSDLITIESELTARQSELESLQAQQRALADQVAQATLSVRLTSTPAPNQDDGDAGFLGNLGKGWQSLLNLGAGLIEVVGLLLPWLGLVLVLGVPLWLLGSRRRQARSITVSEPATSGPAPQPE